MTKPSVRLCPYSCGFSTANPRWMVSHVDRIHPTENKDRLVAVLAKMQAETEK